MHLTLRNEKVLLAAIAAASATMLKPNAYDADKVQQLKDLGFINSDFITNSDDHLANSPFAVQYQEKYSGFKFLTQVQMNSIFADFDLGSQPLHNVFRDVPDNNLKDILAFEIERGLIEAPGKQHYYDYVDIVKPLFYSSPFGKSSELWEKMRKDIAAMGANKSNTVTQVYYPKAETALQLNPGGELEVKKTNHMNALKMNFKDIRKDFPDAISVVTDNLYVEDDEKLNYYLLTLKVKGGLLIITDWQV